MKKTNIIASIGIVIYVIVSFIDRFFIKIPDPIYIGITLFIIGCLMVGINSKNR